MLMMMHPLRSQLHADLNSTGGSCPAHFVEFVNAVGMVGGDLRCPAREAVVPRYVSSRHEIKRKPSQANLSHKISSI